MTDELLTIEVRPEGEGVVLAVSGELDIASCGSLQACLNTLDPGFRSVELNLADLTFLDSSGIGLIVRTNEVFRSELRELTVRCPQGPVRRVLSMSGIDQSVKVIDG